MTRTIPILLLTLTCATFVSCSRQDHVTPSDDGSQNRGASEATPQKPRVGTPAPENQNWTVLTKADLLGDYDGDYFQGIWQPSDSDVRQAIQEARPYLENLKKATSGDYERQRIEEVLAGWDQYECQVIGHTKDGRKLIFLSFFPKTDVEEATGQESASRWRHHYHWVYDGGTDYWQIEYDCKTKTILHFATNGDA